jgi:hypothetical protein
VVLTVCVAEPLAAWDPTTLNDSEEPGSVLVFPRFHTGTVTTVDQGILPRTRFEISVTCPKNFDCSGVGTVFLHAHWVCGGNASNVCQEVDFNLQTTINGTITFNPQNIGPRTTDVPAPPNCPSDPAEEESGGGYLIVWVTDPSNNPIAADALLGDEVILGSSLSAVAYDAIPIQAVAATGTQIGTASGPLLFDGSMYKEVTGTIYGSIPYQSPERETSLILLTLDVQSNLPNTPTFVGLNFYNENENLVSTATNFTCWGKVSLDSLPGGQNLNTDFGTKGLVKSTGAVQGSTPVTLLGVVEREEEFTLPVVGTVTATLSATGGFLGGSSCSVSSSSGVSPSCAAASCTFGSVCFLPNPFTGGCFIGPFPTVTCDISTSVTNNLSITREWGYPFLNDSTPVPTTFVPF